MTGVEDHRVFSLARYGKEGERMLYLQRLKRATIDAALYALLVVELVKLLIGALKTLVR